jgi:NAD(P)-dependent dehydrogenase (short-subunit alcohol dehydrogenase family)
MAIEADVVNVDQVSAKAAAAAMAAAAVAAVGSVDILINNAGGANDTGFPTPRTGVRDRTLGVSAASCWAQPLLPAPSCRSGFGVSNCWR